MSPCLSILGGRASGVLAHVSALPSTEGMGTLGDEAYRFIDSLAAAGQRVWQILPLNPTQGDGSPYAALSSFAGAEQAISLQRLHCEGLLLREELAPLHALGARQIDFSRALPLRRGLCALAARRFLASAGGEPRAEFETFQTTHGSAWLDDYALFRAALEAHDWADWSDWPAALRAREPEAMAQARRMLSGRIAEIQAEQFLFEQQWRALRAHAKARKVLIFGDLPIYVAQTSADVWIAPHLFQLGADGKPRAVAGCPPDMMAARGQRWGNPVYDWEAMQREGFAWWGARLARAFALYDLVRIDHFRAFASYWEIPAEAPDATSGRWVAAPGYALFETLARRFPNLPVVAEDLGFITPDVYELRDAFGFPGMRIIQYELEEEPLAAAQQPAAYPACSVAYFGNHDNETAIGWLERQRANLTSEALAQRPLLAAAQAAPEAHWALNRLALGAGSALAVLQMQDLLGLGAEHRFNVPGTAEGNWGWRFAWEDAPNDLWRRLRAETRAAGRLPQGPRPPAGSTLEALLDEAEAEFLLRQHPLTGLLPAGPARNRHGDYSHAWVRDNAFCVLAIWAAGAAARRAGLPAARWEAATTRLMRGLFEAMRKQADKIERFIASGAPQDALHAKFATATGEPVHGDDEWGHLQLDATALYVLLLADMTAAGLDVATTPADLQFLERLLAYIARAWRTPDFGMWERGDKRNIGRPERNASSIALARAALQAATRVAFRDAAGLPVFLAARPREEDALFEEALRALLPQESLSKEVDSALIAAVGYPGFAAPSPALRAETLAQVRRQLAGVHGYKRFLLDGHQCPKEEPSRLHYESGELASFAGAESEWPLFLAFEAVDALLTGAASDALERLSALSVPAGGWRHVPELFKTEAEGGHTPNENTPLYWAQSLYLVARLLREKLITPDDLDPMGRRAGLPPSDRDRPAPGLRLQARGLHIRTARCAPWRPLREDLAAIEEAEALLAIALREGPEEVVGLDLVALAGRVTRLISAPSLAEALGRPEANRDWRTWREDRGALLPVGGAFSASLWRALPRCKVIRFAGGASLDARLARSDHTENERGFALLVLEALGSGEDLLARGLALEALAAFAAATPSLEALDMPAWLDRTGGPARLGGLRPNDLRTLLLERLTP